jgi:hypothetical protein
MVPWSELLALVVPHFPKAVNGTAAGGFGHNDAGLLLATVVQPVGPRQESRFLRIVGAAPLC